MKKRNSGKKDSAAKLVLIKKRHSKAMKMADSKTVTVTYRIPEELADWLDRYVSLSYPKKIGKGVMVIRSLVLGYILFGEPKEAHLSKMLSGIEFEEL